MKGVSSPQEKMAIGMRDTFMLMPALSLPFRLPPA
jgi:hypothetical protein